MSTYALYAVKVGTTHIPVKSASHNPQINLMLEGGASNIDPDQAGLRGSVPLVRFETPSLATALGVCGTSVPYLAITDANPLILYYAKLTSGGSYSAGADNVSVTCNEGVLMLETLTGDYQGSASASYTMYVTYDGSNLPFIIASNVSLPSVTALVELFTVYAVEAIYAGPTTLQIPIRTAAVNVNSAVLQEATGSGLYPTMGAVSGYKPTATLGTPAIKTALDAIGIDNLVCTSVVVYFAKMNGNAFAAAGNHISATLNDPLLALRGIEARHNEVALANYEAFATYDDTNEPLVCATNANLPTVSALAELFTCGPAEFDSVSFETMSWSLDTGLNIIHEGDSGDHRPTIAAFSKREPTVNVEVLDVPQLPFTGQAESNAEVWLRKMTEGGARVAETTEEHIQFLMASAYSHPGETRGTYGERSVQPITLRPVKSGANDVVAIDTTAYITAP